MSKVQQHHYPAESRYEPSITQYEGDPRLGGRLSPAIQTITITDYPGGQVEAGIAFIGDEKTRLAAIEKLTQEGHQLNVDISNSAVASLTVTNLAPGRGATDFILSLTRLPGASALPPGIAGAVMDMEQVRKGQSASQLGLADFRVESARGETFTGTGERPYLLTDIHHPLSQVTYIEEDGMMAGRQEFKTTVAPRESAQAPTISKLLVESGITVKTQRDSAGRASVLSAFASADEVAKALVKGGLVPGSVGSEMEARIARLPRAEKPQGAGSKTPGH